MCISIDASNRFRPAVASFGVRCSCSSEAGRASRSVDRVIGVMAGRGLDLGMEPAFAPKPKRAPAQRPSPDKVLRRIVPDIDAVLTLDTEMLLNGAKGAGMRLPIVPAPNTGADHRLTIFGKAEGFDFSKLGVSA